MKCPQDCSPSETSENLVSREFSRIFFFIFTSCSRSRAVSISLSLLEKEWRDFIFHFSLLEKSESYPYFTLFSREKRVKSGAGYNLTSIFVPNCISKNCQISSKHQPQNIGQISISKSWLNPVLHVTNNSLVTWKVFSVLCKRWQHGNMCGASICSRLQNTTRETTGPSS